MPPVFLIFVAIVIALVVYGFYTVARRRKILSAWARSRGFSFNLSKDRAMDDRFGAFDCLRRGHSRYAYNVMRGNCVQLDVIAFDYHYATGSGKNRSNHHFSAVVIASPFPLKGLYIRREGVFDKVTEFFGLDDIDFESAEFSRRFYVKAADKRWAYDVIHQRMMEYLLTAPTFTLQFDPHHIIAWRSGRFDTEDFDDAIGLIRGIIDRLPDYLVRQQRERG